MEKNVFTRIMELCEEKGISLRQVHRDLDISLGTISRWKTRTPRIDTLQSVADYFKVDVNYLLGNTPYKNQEDMYNDWDSKYPEQEMTLPDGSIVEFGDNTVTFHSTGGSITYTNYPDDVKQIVETITSDKKLKDVFTIMQHLSDKQFNAIYNMLIAMDDF